MVRNLQGEEVVSNTTIYTQSEIGNEDEIDGQKVIQVERLVDNFGDLVGYQVYI